MSASSGDGGAKRLPHHARGGAGTQKPPRARYRQTEPVKTVASHAPRRRDIDYIDTSEESEDATEEMSEQLSHEREPDQGGTDESSEEDSDSFPRVAHEEGIYENTSLEEDISDESNSGMGDTVSGSAGSDMGYEGDRFSHSEERSSEGNGDAVDESHHDQEGGKVLNGAMRAEDVYVAAEESDSGTEDRSTVEIDVDDPTESMADEEFGFSPGNSRQGSVRRGSLRTEYSKGFTNRSRANTSKEETSQTFTFKESCMTFNIACLSFLQGLLLVPFIILFNLGFVLYYMMFYSHKYWDHGLVTIIETSLFGWSLKALLLILALPAYLVCLTYAILAAILGSTFFAFTHPFITNQTDVREKWHRHTKLSAVFSGLTLTWKHLLVVMEGPAEFAASTVFEWMKAVRDDSRDPPFDLHLIDLIVGLLFGVFAVTFVTAFTVLIVALKSPFLLGRVFIELYTKPGYYGVRGSRMMQNPCLLIGYYLAATVLAPVIWIVGILGTVGFAIWKAAYAAFDIITSNRPLADFKNYFKHPITLSCNTVRVVNEQTTEFILEGRVETWDIHAIAPVEGQISVYHFAIGTVIGISGMIIVGVPMVFYWIRMLPMFLARNVYKYCTGFRMLSRPSVQAPLWLFGLLLLLPVSLLVWVFLLLYGFVAGFGAGLQYFDENDVRRSFREMGAIMLRIDQRAVAYIWATDDTYGASGCLAVIWRISGDLVETEPEDDEEALTEEGLDASSRQVIGSAHIWNEDGQGRHAKARSLVGLYGYDPAARLQRKLQAVRGMRPLPKGESTEEEQDTEYGYSDDYVEEADQSAEAAAPEGDELTGCLCIRRCCRSRKPHVTEAHDTQQAKPDYNADADIPETPNSSEDAQDDYLSDDSQSDLDIAQVGEATDRTEGKTEGTSEEVEKEVTEELSDQVASPMERKTEEVGDEVDEETRQALDRSRKAIELADSIA